MKLETEALQSGIAERLGLTPDQVFGHGYTLREVIALSPSAINSIDTLEAFIGAMADHGVDGDLGLPAITNDDQIDEVIALINQEIEKLPEG